MCETGHGRVIPGSWRPHEEHTLLTSGERQRCGLSFIFNQTILAAECQCNPNGQQRMGIEKPVASDLKERLGWPRWERWRYGLGSSGCEVRSGTPRDDSLVACLHSGKLVVPFIRIMSWPSTKLLRENLTFVLDLSKLNSSVISQRKCQVGSRIHRPGSQREVQARGRHDELYNVLKVRHKHNWHY